MPQGDAERGEGALETAQRELREETGLTLKDPQVLSGQFSYMIPGDGGKLQTWVRSEWCGCKVDVHCGPYQEFRGFEWLTPDGVIERCVWFKRDVYRAVLQLCL